MVASIPSSLSPVKQTRPGVQIQLMIPVFVSLYISLKKWFMKMYTDIITWGWAILDHKKSMVIDFPNCLFFGQNGTYSVPGDYKSGLSVRWRKNKEFDLSQTRQGSVKFQILKWHIAWFSIKWYNIKLFTKHNHFEAVTDWSGRKSWGGRHANTDQRQINDASRDNKDV